MAINTQNRRRAAGCHPCLSVPAVPNLGLAAPDRPQLAWVYPELYERPHPADLVFVLEALSATGVVMENLTATALTEEALTATPSSQEALAAATSLREDLSATPSLQEALSATVTVAPL
jgi:hypothetical protein